MKSKKKNFSYLFLLATVISLNSWAQPTREIDFQPLSQEMLNNPEPEDWLMWRGGYENWGYSPLEQIDRENVKNKVEYLFVPYVNLISEKEITESLTKNDFSIFYVRERIKSDINSPSHLEVKAILKIC